MSREEAAQICARFQDCLPDLIVIGGQAVAAWAEHFQILGAPTSSKDLDFASKNRRTPEQVGEALHGQVYVGSPIDDTYISAQVAKVSFTHKGRVHVIDFLGTVVGIQDTGRMWARAIVYTPPGTELVLRILHPLDCLYSRVGNVLTYPDKYDTDIGRAQLVASCEVFRRFVGGLVASGEPVKVQAAAKLTRELLSYLTKNWKIRYVGGQDLHACLIWHPEFEPYLSEGAFKRAHRRLIRLRRWHNASTALST